MSEVKDKLITAESLKNAYDDNKNRITELKGDIVNLDIVEYKNLVDISSEETDKYWANIGGKVGKVSGTNVSVVSKIKLSKGILYSLNHLRRASFCIIGDLQDNYIGAIGSQDGFSWVNSNEYIGIFTPTDDCYLYMTYDTQFSHMGAMCVMGELPIAIKPFDTVYRTNIGGLSNEWVEDVVIDASGNGDFTSISNAITYINKTNRTSSHIINLYVKDGTYTETSEITLPDKVNIIGQSGNKNNCIINFIPSDTSDSEITEQSLFKQTMCNDFKNITFTAINSRYVMHSESNNDKKNWIVNIDNCKFIHYANTKGNWTTQHAWGEGASSGSKLYAKNTDFITYATGSQSSGFSVHNNTNFESPMYHQFDNCKFYSSAGSSFRCEGLASGTDDKCVLNGCFLEQNFYMTNDLTIRVECNSCNLVGTNTTSYFDKNSIAYYTDCLIELTNNTGDTIPKGSIVAFNGNKNNIKLANADDIIVGFTIGDTESGNKATIVTKGYYNTLDGATLGSKYSVSNGILTASEVGTVATALGYGWTYICGNLVN